MFKLVGQCNHCGECCRKLIDIRMRIDMNPWSPCKFLKNVDGKFYCAIQNGDVKVKELSKFERRYYESQCLKWPDPNDESHWDGSMPEGCGYSREKDDTNK